MTLTRRTALGLLAAAPFVIRPARAATAPVFQRDGLAISGIDPVAYFTQARPVPGDPAFTAEWNGALWRFANAANRDRFLADPVASGPAYGGYCAYAVSQGYTAKTEPEAWSIHGGRLFLNFDLRVRRIFERDPQGYIAAADGNWPGVLNA